MLIKEGRSYESLHGGDWFSRERIYNTHYHSPEQNFNPIMHNRIWIRIREVTWRIKERCVEYEVLWVWSRKEVWPAYLVTSWIPGVLLTKIESQELGTFLLRAMNILSWNCHGLGYPQKINALQNLVEVQAHYYVLNGMKVERIKGERVQRKIHYEGLFSWIHVKSASLICSSKRHLEQVKVGNTNYRETIQNVDISFNLRLLPKQSLKIDLNHLF